VLFKRKSEKCLTGSAFSWEKVKNSCRVVPAYFGLSENGWRVVPWQK